MELSVADMSPRSQTTEPPAPALAGRLPRWFEDWHGWIAATIYLVVIVAYERYPLEHIQSVCSCLNSDPTQWMWSWKWFIYAIGHGHNPLFTDRIWSGQNFSLAGITLSPTAAIAGIPLTALFGTVAAYNLLMVAAPVISGWAAYRLCRYLSGAPWASILAGYTYGFSAYELGHLLGHLNLIYVFVPPMLVLLILRYANGEVSPRRMLISGSVLLIIQFGLSTEVLFDMTCMGIAAFIFALVCLPGRRPRLLESAAMLIIAYVVMGVICSYYIYQSLRGPTESVGAAQGFTGDLVSYFVPSSTFKLGAVKFASVSSKFMTNNQFEQNNYLGAPLCGILLAFTFTCWRRRVTRVIALTALVAFIWSLGVTLTIDGQGTITMPFHLLASLPLFKLITPSRLGLFVALPAALATALWISWARSPGNRIWRWIVGLAAVAFLLPNSGLSGRINGLYNPPFFTTSLYKKYLKPNEIVLTIPYSGRGDDMLWQADTGMYFRQAGGYLGNPPPWYAGYPIVEIQLFTGAPAPDLKDAVPQLGSLLSDKHVGAVLVQPGAEQNWPAVLKGDHFHLEATAGGMEVYTPDTGSAPA